MKRSKILKLSAQPATLGITLGVFSKYLDHSHARLPQIFQNIDQLLDFHNFLGGLAPWIVIGTYLSLSSRNPRNAALRVFLFCVLFISSYYLYSYYIAGFYPYNYAKIWIILTVVSPIMGYITRYSKKKNLYGFIISSLIIGSLMWKGFSYGIRYISISSWLNILMLVIGVCLLHTSTKHTMMTIGGGIIVAILLQTYMPYVGF